MKIAFINKEEEIILNSILPFIPYKGIFNVLDIYDINILIPKYNFEINQHNLLYHQDKLKLIENGTINNITQYLLDAWFANEVERANGIALILTVWGVIAKAYGDIELYKNADRRSLDKDEIEKKIPFVIEKAFYNGEFTFEPSFPDNLPMKVVNINLSDKEVDIRKTVFDGINKPIIEEHIEYVKDECVLDYLVQNGFAFNRHDIKDRGKLYRQLTDKGRKLKELGSIKAYAYYEEECLKMEVRQRVRDEYLYWIQFWIAVGAVSAAIYYLLEILRIQYRFGLPYHVHFS